MDYQFLMPRTFGSSVEFLNLTARLCKRVIADGIDGDFMEVGVAYGSHGVVMMDNLEGERKIWLCDSFEGISLHGPEDKEWTEAHGVREKSDPRASGGITSCSVAQVEETIRMAGQDPNDFIFVKGWVADTLPVIASSNSLKIAVLRLDVDLYSPYMTCFEFLLPSLSIGAFLVIDDWCLSGLQQALNDSGLEPWWFTLETHNNYTNAYLEWTLVIKESWEAKNKFKKTSWA